MIRSSTNNWFVGWKYKLKVIIKIPTFLLRYRQGDEFWVFIREKAYSKELK